MSKRPFGDDPDLADVNENFKADSLEDLVNYTNAELSRLSGNVSDESAFSMKLTFVRLLLMSKPIGSQDFYNELVTWMQVHASKSQDYANTNEPFKNFEEAAAFAGISVPQQFWSLIGTKMSRIHNLRTNKKKHNNESPEDSLMDLAIYIGLLLAYSRTH